MYTRTTTDVFVVQVKGQRRTGTQRDGWSDLQTETSSAAAYAWLTRQREGCQYRIVKRRRPAS